MAENSLDNSANTEKPPYESRILFTHSSKGYALLRVPLDSQFKQCNPSLVHEYLWALSELIEREQINLYRLWENKIQENSVASLG